MTSKSDLSIHCGSLRLASRSCSIGTSKPNVVFDDSLETRHYPMSSFLSMSESKDCEYAFGWMKIGCADPESSEFVIIGYLNDDPRYLKITRASGRIPGMVPSKLSDFAKHSKPVAVVDAGSSTRYRLKEKGKWALVFYEKAIKFVRADIGITYDKGSGSGLDGTVGVYIDIGDMLDYTKGSAAECGHIACRISDVTDSKKSSGIEKNVDNYTEYASETLNSISCKTCVSSIDAIGSSVSVGCLSPGDIMRCDTAPEFSEEESMSRMDSVHTEDIINCPCDDMAKTAKMIAKIRLSTMVKSGIITDEDIDCAIDSASVCEKI